MESLQLNVKFNFQQLLEIVKQLSPVEKAKLNEVIWEDNNDIPLEHQKLVLDRVKKGKTNPNSILNWEEASKTLVP